MPDPPTPLRSRLKRVGAPLAAALLIALAAVPTATPASGPAAAAAALQSPCPAPADQGPSSYACDVIGSSHMAATYGFGTECSLQEGARRLLSLGSRVVKVALFDPASRYRFGACDWSGITPATPPAAVAQTPQFRELFAMPFTSYVMQTFSSLGSDYWRNGVSDAQCAQESAEMYDLARELLVGYGATRKQFVVQDWESDWAVRGGTDPDALPSATAVQGLIRFFDCRQSGLERARTTIASGARVLQGCEVNLVDRALQGKPGTVIDDVIPHTRCDLVSYSAWDTLGYAQAGDVDLGRSKFRAALDHIAAKTPDPAPYVRDALCSHPQNVYVGELGSPENDVGTPAATATIAMATQESLAWGARWALYWQLYDNELRHAVPGRPADADVRGFYLVKPSGALAPAGTYLRSVLSTPQPVSPGACPAPPAPPAAPPPGSPPAPPGGEPRDRVRPRITRIRLGPRVLSLRVSEAATVQATVARRVRHGRRLRWRTVARKTLHTRRAGRVATRLKHLGPAVYRVTVRARDRAGNRARTASRRTRIRQPAHRTHTHRTHRASGA